MLLRANVGRFGFGLVLDLKIGKLVVKYCLYDYSLLDFAHAGSGSLQKVIFIWPSFLSLTYFWNLMSKTVKNAAGWHFTRRSTIYTNWETAISKYRKFGHLAAKLWNVDHIWYTPHVENCIENMQVKYEADTFSIKGAVAQNVIFEYLT